jgi:hypothetical protein
MMRALGSRPGWDESIKNLSRGGALKNVEKRTSLGVLD